MWNKIKKFVTHVPKTWTYDINNAKLCGLYLEFNIKRKLKCTPEQTWHVYLGTMASYILLQILSRIGAP